MEKGKPGKKLDPGYCFIIFCVEIIHDGHKAVIRFMFFCRDLKLAFAKITF
jgi:hypothetical protein